MENLSEEQKKVLAKILYHVWNNMDRQEDGTFRVEISFALTWDEAATVSSILPISKNLQAWKSLAGIL